MMLTRQQTFAALAATVTVTFLPRRAPAANVVLHVGSSLEDDVSPLLLAAANGTFARLGLEVQPQAIASGAAGAAAVAGGSLEFCKSSLLALVSAHARNVPFVIVAPGSYTSDADPIAQLVVARSSPIRTAKDFNGKTLGTSSLRDVKMISAMEWIDQHGGDSRTLKFVEVPNSTIVAALEDGRIAGATVLNPVLADGLETGRIRAIGPAFDAIAPRWLVTAWFTTRDYAARNPEIVKKFVQALREASAAVNAHPAQAASVLAPFLHDDAARIAKMKRSPLGVDLDVKEIQPVIDVAARYRVIDKAFPASELIAALPR
ncbi:MAG: ABC transporter substrate-binding protein [Candidatus Eremiobacteraeota bacterium]|nr:ABC transporter substrate-binding protein [Candidatus Eremiobacteraeota bacterium]